ncbi:uncharacterized protein N0V89_010316 [Didymosphaeria variabile]|uniref:Uncharacterized protein n=1 Tax=Didymosphaeria variabile TaxID=1932322 RepID=A0A9W9C717_9PLEO|nr:uncharacterized protein N0V89_010316 [Didymosphaeria variabile]KAJ4346387.1 hypothetical protein N0V89_010316 [Didymosphaeria variabile]
MANKSKRRAHSSGSKESVNTIRPDPETPTRAPRSTAPSEELHTPRINDDGTVGYSETQLVDETWYVNDLSHTGTGYDSPSRDNVPPITPQVPASTHGAATQIFPSPRSVSLISPALQDAIDKAVESAVEKGLKTIQEDSIKIMHDLFKKMANLENEKAMEFRKWFDNRLSGMDNRIQRNKTDVWGAENERTQDDTGDEDEDASGHTNSGTSPPGGRSSAPAGGASSRSQKPSLVSYDTE